jgi:cytochrome c peroxidase
MKRHHLILVALLLAGCEQGTDSGTVLSPAEDALATTLRIDATESDNAVVTLGRVLFYERQLSRDGTISCASCHKQSEGFSDGQRLSQGVGGAVTARHSMSVANTALYPNGRMFWDERAEDLEEQALGPIQNPDEMDLTLDEAVARIDALPYYDVLFELAFGDDEVTMDRMAEALTAFEETIVTRDTKWDDWLAAGGTPGPDPGGLGPMGANTLGVMTDQEDLGRRLFFSPHTQCGACHGGPDFTTAGPLNNGLDLDTSADEGAGRGRFKSPSLRNIELTGPYMHDGRFGSLREVIDHYDSGVQAHLFLDNRLRDNAGEPRRMNLSETEKAALEAFLRTLTDESLAVDERFSDPFIR